MVLDVSKSSLLKHCPICVAGSNGLEELEAIDPSFEEYEPTLFNESSQDWERTLQTSDVNQKLDLAINEFLVKLSPYLLIKSAQKALEWLIYR